MSKLIFIPESVPSLKNSKIKTKRGIFSSKTVKKYLRKLGIQSYNSRKKEVKGYVDTEKNPNKIEGLRKSFEKAMANKPYPIFIGYHHIRNSNRLFDFSNSVEIIQDLLVAHDIIEDDNVKHVFPIPISIEGKLPNTRNIRDVKWYSIDKTNPGVYIKIF